MPSRRSPPPPILKPDTPASSAPTDALPFVSCTAASMKSTRVKFPSTPKLATAQLTYPAHVYDRTAIVVAPNSCAMPRRNERDYNAAPAPAPVPALAASPRAHKQYQYPYHTQPPTGYFDSAAPKSNPGLSWSSSSESDDSDPGLCTPPAQAALQGAPAPASRCARIEAPRTSPLAVPLGDALTFLPYAPTPGGGSPPREKKRRSLTPARPRRSPPASAFATMPDDGCLGGF